MNKGDTMEKEYKVIVKLGEEVFNLTAENEESVLDYAKQIIAEDYNGYLSDNAEYEVIEVK